MMLGFSGEAVSAITAAIIAGVIALLSLIISKEQKVSEFRQQWVDALREDIAAVIAHSHTIQGIARSRPESDQESYWKTVHPDFSALIVASARVRLRLNRSEAKHNALLRAVNELQSVSKTGEIPEPEVLNNFTNKLVVAAQIVLKTEWNRVRRGELVYQVTSAVTLILIVILIAALLRHFF
jgi:hypothetical protein